MTAKRYKPKACERCGGTFEPRSGNAKFCPDCRKQALCEWHRERRKDPAFRERRRERERELRKDPACRERHRERERERWRDPAYRERQRERRRERLKDPAYRERQREQARERNRERRRRKKASRGALFSRCYLCGDLLSPSETVDEHVLPLARFGGHEGFRELLAPACAPCNLAKGKKTIREWVEEAVRARESARALEASSTSPEPENGQHAAGRGEDEAFPYSPPTGSGRTARDSGRGRSPAPEETPVGRCGLGGSSGNPRRSA